MTHPMHESVTNLIQQAVALMDDLLRFRIELSEYSEKLKALDVESVMVAHQEEFKTDASLVYYLDALMLLSSLQHELDFQVAEYGVSVALEDMRNLEELEKKFPKM
jgi:hypothetical protein